MTKEKLFELAVSLVAANIGSGQFQTAMNFGTIINDDVQIAYEQLEAVWQQISEGAEAIDAEVPEGSISH
ncbi:hypothetical protein [Mesorhizobium sp. 2RAF21]|uniref:hypothetical protein n=1 Tax=Mesorhizobium sp. 2RAF21 TaxID=3232995 RepID=UPI003F97C106